MELTLLQYIASITPLLLLLITLLRPVRTWVKKLWEKTVGRKAAQLNRIEAELHPNGGFSIRDVLNRIEATLIDSDAFLRAQLNIHAVSVVRTDIQGKLTQVNRQYQRMVGYSISELVGDGWVNAIHPDNRDKIISEWNDAVSKGIEYSQDIKYLKGDGTDFTAHVNMYRELDLGGNIHGYLGVVIPIQDEFVCPHASICKIGGVLTNVD